jgi:hypothetical protein
LNSITGLVRDLDGLASGGYAELPADRYPAFAPHDLPELGYERSRQKPDWPRSCTVAGRHDDGDPVEYGNEGLGQEGASGESTRGRSAVGRCGVVPCGGRTILRKHGAGRAEPFRADESGERIAQPEHPAAA